MIGIENQSAIHYAMAIRSFLSDAIHYAAQADTISKANRLQSRLKDSILEKQQKSEKYPETREEFLSGLRKTDRLLPVITITIYWGAEPWDAARKLSDLLFPVEEPLQKYINDYHLNLLIPSEITDFDHFHTEMKQVMLAISTMNNKESLQQVIQNKIFEQVDRETADIICAHTSLKRPRAKGGNINMCKAVRELKEESEAIGEARGEARGEAIGEARGKVIGEERFAQLIQSMIADGKSDQISEVACLSPSARLVWFERYHIK